MSPSTCCERKHYYEAQPEQSRRLFNTRVDPRKARWKLAAWLQAATPQGRPVAIYFLPRAGGGAGVEHWTKNGAA
jgi:hypothetical protein